MDVYKAIMQAADHIQSMPGEFNINSVLVPKRPGCGSPGCALGWISHFAGVKGGETYSAHILGAMKLSTDREFYPRMSELNGEAHTVTAWNEWARDAALCARTLRLYAAKYHAPAQRTDSELVADLMARVCGERIAEEA